MSLSSLHILTPRVNSWAILLTFDFQRCCELSAFCNKNDYSRECVRSLAVGAQATTGKQNLNLESRLCTTLSRELSKERAIARNYLSKTGKFRNKFSRTNLVVIQGLEVWVLGKGTWPSLPMINDGCFSAQTLHLHWVGSLGVALFK